MIALGMISGTSHDGIDVAVVEFVGGAGGVGGGAGGVDSAGAVAGGAVAGGTGAAPGGPALSGTVLYTDSVPYSAELRDRLVRALPPAATTFAEMCELDTLIGQAFAEVAAGVVDRVDARIDVIASHGQTVFHWVENNRALGTLQIGQPAWIAERTGIPVVSDLRSRDIAAGGQGAPLVSHLDSLLLAGLGGTAAALNLGGISNMTVLRAGGAIAYDIGPANALLDAVVRGRGAHPRGFDVDGALASGGTVDKALLASLLEEPYYRMPAPKSTGKELFNSAYVDRALAAHVHAPELSTPDLLATLAELTARTVADEVLAHGVDTLVVSGGGWRNADLIGRLRRLLPDVALVPSDTLGAPADDKEAIAFALLGWCTLNGVPSTVPSATGAAHPSILGTITPGAGPLRLPAPAEHPVSLTLTMGQ